MWLLYLPKSRIGMIETVKTLLFRGDGPGVVFECRQCGTTVESEDDVCPACGSEGIARFPTG